MTEETTLEELEKEPTTPVIEEEQAEETSEEKSEEQSEETKPEPEKPKENRYSKRVKELNTKWREAERKAEALEKQLQEKEEASKLKQAPDPDDFADDGEYQAKQKQWDKQVRDSIRKEERQKIQSEIEYKKQQQKIDEGKKSYIKSRSQYIKGDPDFHKYEVEIDEAVEEYQAPEIQNIILESKELGPEIVAHFGKNPDELLDIASSSPAQRFFKMGQLITKLEARPVKKTSSAPDPVRSERGSAKKVTLNRDAPYDSKRESFAEYSRRRNGL